MKFYLVAAFIGLVAAFSNVTDTITTSSSLSQSCECSVTRIERLCPRRLDDVRRCNCIDRALRSCSTGCPDFEQAQQLSCRITSSNTTTSNIRVAAAAISPSNMHAPSLALAPATNLRLAADPRRPSAIQCGGARHSPCPRNQACSVDTKSGSGFCTGAPCFLGASRSGRGTNELCPSSPSLGPGYRQICVQKPRKDSRVLTDLPGLCADPDMKCGGAFGGCPRGWSCQGPNGDGDVCQGEAGCQGLCMHVGDGRA